MTFIDSAAASKSAEEGMSHFLCAEASRFLELLEDFAFCPRESLKLSPGFNARMKTKSGGWENESNADWGEGVDFLSAGC